MDSYHNILAKLNDFTKKYYTKLLIKGLLLFLAFGLLFFFITLGIEYFLWLNSTGRLMLLLLFIAIEGYLLFKFILTPIFYLFKLKKGISNKQASLMIGHHFSNIDDKLYNLLDLVEDKNQSELLLASIEQRSRKLDVIPFLNAIDFKENLKYAKYLVIPALFFGLIWLSGNLKPFLSSTERIVNFDTAYTPPAPFTFKLLSNDLDILNDKEYTISVVTVGELKPEAVYIEIDGNKLLLGEVDGVFQYTLKPPFKSADFFFEANAVQSRSYRINALETPSIQNFELRLDYPSYLNRKADVLKSTGNATFPEGTKVTWSIVAQNTENITLIESDTALVLRKTDSSFDWSKRVYSNYAYEIATSNKYVDNYEKLAYEFKVVKDAHPTIKVAEVKDSINYNTFYYSGEVSDDYGLHSIALVYYSEEESQKKERLNLKKLSNNFDRFYYTFPSGLNLDVSKTYSYYFEVTDNDAIHKGKKSKSQVFSTSLLNADELKNKELESQQSIIKNLGKSLVNYKEQKEKLNEINKEQKEKKSLNFNDQTQLKDFLKKQEQQENMMQKFSKELKENLEKNEGDDKMSELLKERLERQEIEAKKNEKLLNELNELADKIDKDDLKKRLEELGKNQQKSERNLEQLVELTKRYYVTEKAAQLATELKKLAEAQEKAAEENLEDEIEKQKQLNEKFNTLSDEMKELEKDNQELKKPLNLSIDDTKQEDTKQDQQQATDALEKEAQESSGSNEKQEANKKAANKQKAAAQKMKEMSEQLQESSSGGGGGSSITEDAEMLRQILDNLITFSFKQEKLYDDLSKSDIDLPQFAGSIKAQQELRELFEHVDDSLFALSLRRVELSEFVNEEITEIYYNTDKALDLMAESQIFQGVGYQKYVISSANSLSDFLANILDNMQESMQSGKGKGEGQGFQLPDIIKSQSELSEKMNGKEKGKDGGEQGEEGKEGQGKEGQGKEGQGKTPGEGQPGSAGKSGSSGQGENGQGENGQGENEKNQGVNGKGGQNGKNGGSGPLGEGSENGPSEEELKEIFEIYKAQQKIRQELEKQLEDMINQGDRNLGKKLIKQMEDFENELLENGITQAGKNKINTIKYELIKLQNAAMKQGEKKERESNTNQINFNNPILTQPLQLKRDRNEIEILNRESLPLKQNYKNKVKYYFRKDD